MMDTVLPAPIKFALYLGIGMSKYLCGLATVTSASRMTFAFAQDGGLLLIFIGVQPPNEKALEVTVGALVATAIVWFGYERRRFQGPPQGVMIQQRQAEIEQAEQAVGETHHRL